MTVGGRSLMRQPGRRGGVFRSAGATRGRASPRAAARSAVERTDRAGDTLKVDVQARDEHQDGHVSNLPCVAGDCQAEAGPYHDLRRSGEIQPGPELPDAVRWSSRACA